VRVEQLAPCSPPAVVLRFDEVAPNMPVGRTVMVCDAQTRGRAVLNGMSIVLLMCAGCRRCSARLNLA